MPKIKKLLTPISLIGRISNRKKCRLSSCLNSWQAAFGYSIAVTWLMIMLAMCYIVISGNENAAEIISALVETTSLWGVALGVLGISFVKGNPTKTKTKTNKKAKQITVK